MRGWLIVALLAAMAGCPPSAAAATARAAYLALAAAPARPDPVRGARQPEDGLAGARLALAENTTTGRFLGQDFVLREVVEANGTALLEAARHQAEQGVGLFITALPAKLLLQLADLPALRGATIIDTRTADDALRGPQCRGNVLHTAPSRAMLADALMQYLVVKNWRRIMLLKGKSPGDLLYAEAVRRAAAKFRITVAADRDWTFNAAAQQADTGHFQVNVEAEAATTGPEYDVLVVADEAGDFGDQLAYRTRAPRPVAGTQGLVPSAWARPMDEYGSTQLQGRFLRAAGRWMDERDYTAWLAMRAIGEAATRSGSTDAAAIGAFLRGPDFQLAGYKGLPMSFRPWDGQLRQPVLLADARSLVSISPQPGFLHQFNILDTLGADQPETECRH